MSDSLDKMVEKIQAVVDKVEKKTPKGLANMAIRVLSDAAPRAPVDLGPLRGSGYVDMGGSRIASSENESGIVAASGSAPDGATSATIGFSEIYAHYQHEHTEFNHPKGGEAKYLENAMEDLLNSGELEQILADAIWGDDE